MTQGKPHLDSHDESISQMPAQAAFQALEDDPKAQLIDVRSRAEWTFVGVPELGHIGRRPLLIEWQQFPSMAVDPQFADRLDSALQEQGADHDTALFFLCRSGQRSLAAAMAMHAVGYRNCINVSDGFEGDMDAARQRGGVNGWKAAGLPWVQS